MNPAPSPTERDPAAVRGMFDSIAPRYDALNHLLSFGLDFGWRARLVREMGLPPDARLLDVCAGTGDLALAFREVKPVGCDFSLGMLGIGKAKGLSAVAGDALRLPFRDGAFDAAVCAFGFRNTSDWAQAAREFVRVARPGGKVGILDFGMPEGVLSGPYRFYLRSVLPKLAGLLSQRGAYEYLQASVEHFHRTADVPGLLKAAGCPEVRRIPMTMGTAVIWVGSR